MNNASINEYRLRNRSKRDESFIVEGRWAVEALLASSLQVRSVLVVEGQHDDLAEKASAQATVLRRSKAEVQELVGFSFHHGVLACALRPSSRYLHATLRAGSIVVCPEIADESNLGTIVRTAAAFGVAGVAVAANRGADVYSRKAIRASSGAVFRIPIVESPDLHADVTQLRNLSFEIVGSTLSPEAIAVSEVPKLRDFVLLLGSEATGLAQSWIDVCDLRVTIPMANAINSLNVGCSSAVLLYELMRRRESANDV